MKARKKPTERLVRESALTILLSAARLWEARAAILRSRKLLRLLP